MTFDPPLQSATLLKRYKRFLADVRLADGTETTIHVANTGAMTGCAEPGSTIYYSTSSNTKRKYPCSWELTETSQGHLICVNTIRANQLVEEAILAGRIPELTGYKNLQREVKYGAENSKIDFLLTEPNASNSTPTDQLADKAFVEVKSVTLLEDGQGYFPDTVTTRGQKHLRELIEVADQGHRAVLLFAVLHTGITSVKPAAHIDKTYADIFTQAQSRGVEIITYQAHISSTSVVLNEL